MGITDRVIRIILGVIIAVLGIHFGSWWGLIALIPLLTGLIGYCPLYTLFGISTRKQ